MKTTHNNRKSKFLAFLLSVMMVSTAGAMFASCADGDESSSTSSSEETKEEEETRTDDGVIKNANFDFTKINDKTVIGTSVTGWSRSVNSQNNASKSTSGVIDTAKWDYMTTTTKTKEQLEAMTEAEVIDAWENFTAQDKLTYYDVWKAKEENKGKTLSTSTFEKYESLNVDAEDLELPATNPGKVGTNDSNILMIHNHYYYSSSTKEKVIGTAQKWTSSSTVTVPAGTSAKVSVSVKTAELTMATTGTPSEFEEQKAVGKGAYISLTHSVGGKSLDAYEVKNIDVDDWTQYTFYIRGSNYADTTYSLVLGLGQGDEYNRFEYVNGFAFFDDIQCEIIDNSVFEANTKDNTFITGLNDEKIDKTFDAYETPDATVFGMDFATSDWNKPDSISFADTPTTGEKGKNPTAEKDFVKVTTIDTIKTELGKTTNKNPDYDVKNLDIVYDKFLANVNENTDDKDDDTDNAKFLKDNDQIFLMLSNNGTAYTANFSYTVEEDGTTTTYDTLNLAADKDYMAISFYVKTSDMNGGVGAGVTLTDALSKTSFTSIDTTDIAKVKIDKDKDAYDGWQRVFFFIERGEDADGAIPLSLTFNYGPTDITSSTTADSFQQGFAAFTKFEIYYDMTELEYEAATTGTYAKKVTVYGEKEDKPAGNSGFDSAVAVPSDVLENGGYANLQNYKGVYSDSYRVALPLATDTAEDKERKRAYNNYVDANGNLLAGLLNKEYADNWAYGDATQPLVIDNSGLTTKSYGFIGNSKSLSEEYTAVSLRVMTTEGAKASVYLVDMSDETRQTMLSVSRSLTYWYDADGNITTGDPAEKASQIAFNLDKSGLYRANKNWANYGRLSADMKDGFFANLNAYTEKDGILYANENSANHYYNAYNWEREVFYKHENAWYTQPEGKGVRVYNLADITAGTAWNSASLLDARYLPNNAQELKLENIDTNGKWTTVTFYIRKGESTKDYRLEVWSGTRDGKTVNTKGIVAFDTNNPGTASSNFDTLIEEYKDTASSQFESVFSYYDTDMHVRFDAAQDTEKRGNAYEDNAKATLSAEASMAYLKHYSEETGYNVFADYTLSDKTVAASEVEDDDDTTDDSSEDETTASAADGWLLASSIAVAAVLVLAVASVATRKIVDKVRKNRGKKVRKEKAEKAPKQKKVEKTVDEDSPYND